MFLRSLGIDSFRNIEPQSLHFNADKNYFFGDNAQGKTNLLEAIYLLCLCKSFRSATDQEMLRMGADVYSLRGLFIDSQNIEREVSFCYSGAAGKQISLDGKPVHHYSTLVGLFPVVILSVADYDITHGAPQQRRRFMNILSSQCSPRYLNDLKEYERIVKQRNRVLTLIQTGKQQAESELEVWDEQLVQRGSALIRFRHKIISELNELVQSYYQTIAWGRREIFSIRYQSRLAESDDHSLPDHYAKALQRIKKMEIQRGMTLMGPHRDDFIFRIGDRSLKSFGSRGEHKSALISLKAAEVTLLRQKLNTSPLLLLDDLYAELDRIRGEKVLDIFMDDSQCFITATTFDYAALQGTRSLQNQKTLFFVTDGKFSVKNNGS